MSGFSAEWLALRGSFDAAGRSRHLAESFAEAIGAEGPIVDLGAGTGANLRYLRGIVGSDRRWRLAEMDAGLLAQAPVGPGIEHWQCDLRWALDDLLQDAAGVTGSALLDLVSASWMMQLASIMARRRLPALFALSYDGRIAFAPADPLDEVVVEAFNRHQATDKGFGPALGPEAVRHLRAALRAAGAAVVAERSDWTIAPSDAVMALAMIEGLVAPALAMAPANPEAIADWARRRRTRIADAALAITVGHRDLLATWV